MQDSRVREILKIDLADFNRTFPEVIRKRYPNEKEFFLDVKVADLV
jgi:hypothetical protein